MCTFKLPVGIEESRSPFRVAVNVLTVDVIFNVACFAVLYSVCCAVFVENEYSVTSFSEGMSNDKYPMKGKLATTTTKTKRRLPNNLLLKTGIRQRAISDEGTQYELVRLGSTAIQTSQDVL